MYVLSTYIFNITTDLDLCSNFYLVILCIIFFFVMLLFVFHFLNFENIFLEYLQLFVDIQ